MSYQKMMITKAAEEGDRAAAQLLGSVNDAKSIIAELKRKGAPPEEIAAIRTAVHEAHFQFTEKLFLEASKKLTALADAYEKDRYSNPSAKLLALQRMQMRISGLSSEELERIAGEYGEGTDYDEACEVLRQLRIQGKAIAAETLAFRMKQAHADAPYLNTDEGGRAFQTIEAYKDLTRGNFRIMLKDKTIPGTIDSLLDEPDEVKSDVTPPAQ